MEKRLKHSILIVLGFIILLYTIELLERSLGLQLYRWGIFPGQLRGLPGILFAPLIHGSWHHLVANSSALLILGTALLYGYPRTAIPVIVLVYIGSGIGVWLFARESFHFGASGLTHGVMFFVFTAGILRRDRLSVALAMIVFLLYGSMVWSIFPQQQDISYESHFFGAVTGILAAFVFRNRDPSPPEKKYDWEGEEPDNEDDSPFNEQ